MVNVHYPVLEAAIVNAGVSMKHVRELLEISPDSLRSRRRGLISWTLEECIILRNLLAPELSIEELFTVMPKVCAKPEVMNEGAIRGGFNPLTPVESPEEGEIKEPWQ